MNINYPNFSTEKMLFITGPASGDRFARKRSLLIESAYSSIMDHGGWKIFLRQLVEATNSRSARMLVMNPEADFVASSIKVNIDDNWHRGYVDHYVNCCPWRPELSRMKPGRLYSTYLHFSCRQKDFYRTEFFNEWAGPQNIHHGMCGTVFRDSRQTVQLLIQRTKGQKYFAENETAFINELVPHIQNSLQITGQVYETRAQTEAITIASGLETAPFLLLDRHLKVIFRSPGAEGFLKDNSLLQITGNRLSMEDFLHNRNLNILLRECLKSAESRKFNISSGILSIPRHLRPDLHLLGRPVHPDIPVLVSEPAIYVALYLYDPAARINLSLERLKRFYSLSEAEIRVIMAMLATADSGEAARKCFISLHTLRSHLKSIFSKTNTRNRAELMKCLLTGPARMH